MRVHTHTTTNRTTLELAPVEAGAVIAALDAALAATPHDHQRERWIVLHDALMSATGAPGRVIADSDSETDDGLA